MYHHEQFFLQTKDVVLSLNSPSIYGSGSDMASNVTPLVINSHIDIETWHGSFTSRKISDTYYQCMYSVFWILALNFSDQE